MTDTKPEGPYEAEALGEQYAVFGPTVPERDQKDSQFYVGGISKCVALSNALNFAYAAGRASRDRLREALAIFAKEADEWEPYTSDSVKLQGRLMGWTGAKGHIDQMEETLISVGDLRKAKEALAEDEKEGK